jgi:hypothetical protein
MSPKQEVQTMDWYDQPAQSPPADRNVSGIRRGLLTAVLAVGLLGVGGVAAVMAASPDPSATPTPNATTQPPDNGGTTAPSTRPGRGSGHDCPNMGDKSGGSTDGSSGSSGSGSSGSSDGVSGSDA